MTDVPAGECKVYLFEGGRSDVQARVNEFLATHKDNAFTKLVDVVFNYQGQEYDGVKAIPDSSSFGIGLVFQYVFPGTEEAAAYDSPLKRIIASTQAAPVCALTPEMIFTIASAASQPPEPNTRIGRTWKRLSRRFL